MRRTIPSAAVPALLALLLIPALPARAGPGRDNCTGYIDATPVTISTGGVWCLRKNHSVSTAGGGVIMFNANNVTLDCNGFLINHADPANNATAVNFSGNNVTLRNCSIRNFYRGVSTYGAGALVEDNRFLQTGYLPIYVQSTGGIIRRNYVFGVGNHASNNGAVTAVVAYGSGDVIDNVIDNVTPAADVSGNASPTALYLYIISGQVSGNRIRNLVSQGTGASVGIDSWGGTPYILRNHVVGPALNKAGNYSIRCAGGGDQSARDNVLSGFAYVSGNSAFGSVIGCQSAGGQNVDKL